MYFYSICFPILTFDCFVTKLEKYLDLNGGEKSRFITQLEIENIHNLKQIVVAPKTPIIKTQLIK